MEQNQPQHWDNTDWLEQTLVECESSLEKFAIQFLGSEKDGGARFDRDFSNQHQKFFEVWDDPSIQRILVLAHRGWGKTSLFTYAAPAQAIVFDKYKFIAPCSATSKIAVMQTENLKREIRNNKQIVSLIGDIKEGSQEFTKEGWETAQKENGNGGHLILPRGVGQQIRGVLHGNHRMELGICDDLETPEGVRSETQRKYLREWFKTDFSLAVDKGSSAWRIVVVGTLLSDSSLVAELRESSRWTTVEMPLCNNDGKFISNWPEYMTSEQVMEWKLECEEDGDLDFFYREVMNIAIPPETAVFKSQYFQTYDEAELNLNDRDDVKRVVIVDPAKTATTTSDFTAIVGLAVDTRAGAIYVRDIVNERLTPDKITDYTFDMAQRLNCSTVGYEVTSLNEWIVQPFTNAAFQRRFYGELVELKPRRGAGDFSIGSGGKDARIAALAPFYRRGQVFHNPTCCADLELQLTRFPKAKYDDVADALAYIIQMMFIGDVYFSPPDQADGENDDDDFERRCALMEAADGEPYGEVEVCYD
jgi:hypothetical protein